MEQTKKPLNSIDNPNIIWGSHDTMTYTKTCNPFSIFAKCQNLNIREQVELGIRCFDLRIRFNFKGDKQHFCHGLINYTKETVQSVLEYLDGLEGPIYVRLMYENIYGDKHIEDFKCFMDEVKILYPNIKFMFCKKKPELTILENNFDKEFKEIQFYPRTLQEVIFTPNYYKYDQIRDLNIIDCNNKIILMDFVELLRDYNRDINYYKNGTD